MVVHRVRAWAEEDKQQEGKAEHHCLLTVIHQRKETVR
jgi:hypothetical protein